MNKQIQAIDQFIANFESLELPQDNALLFLAMFDAPQEDATNPSEELRKVEIKTLIEGYEEDIYQLFIEKMIDVPVLKQVLTEALLLSEVKPQWESFDKWRHKNKYDNAHEPLELPTAESLAPLEGEVAPYIAQIQSFVTFMNEKQSRNLTLLLLAKDDLNAAKTTFAMGYAQEIATMLSKELKENYTLLTTLEQALYAVEKMCSIEEWKEWKDFCKKKK